MIFILDKGQDTTMDKKYNILSSANEKNCHIFKYLKQAFIDGEFVKT